MQEVTIHALSDAVGDTAGRVARAALAQFPQIDSKLIKTSMIRDVETLRQEVEPYLGLPNHIFLYTFARGDLADEMELLTRAGANAVDVLGPTIMRIERITEQRPSAKIGALRKTDAHYFERIDAMEFAVAHDDGRKPEGLMHADVVIIGVSRTSKTPLSMYLAYRGVRAANVPLTPGTEPPKELFEIDPRKIYGLISTPEVLLEVRRARMKELGAYVSHYADLESINQELDEARALMRRLGCIVISTANRAIEEVALEILSYVSKNG